MFAQTYDNSIGKGNNDFSIREDTIELFRDPTIASQDGYDFYAGKIKTDRPNFTMDVTAIIHGQSITDHFRRAPICH